MTHRHVSGELRCTGIASNVCLQPIKGGGKGVTYSDTGKPVPPYFAGFIIGHDREGLPHRCEGFVTVGRSPNATPAELAGPIWGMSGSLEGGDLSLTPSILCRLGDPSMGECGFHGFVTNGGWVPA